MKLIDYDANGDQELIISLGSPSRGFAIINSTKNGLKVIKKVRPDELLVGSGLLYVGAVDYDRDGFDDVLAISPDGNTLKVQPFYNVGGVFDSGSMVIEKVEGINGILPYSMNISDWDADGFKDLIIPFKSGHIIAFTLTPATLVIDKLPIDLLSIDQIVFEDFDQDNFEDILILSTDLNLLSLVSGKSGNIDRIVEQMNEIPNGATFFNHSHGK